MTIYCAESSGLPLYTTQHADAAATIMISNAIQSYFIILYKSTRTITLYNVIVSKLIKTTVYTSNDQ